MTYDLGEVYNCNAKEKGEKDGDETNDEIKYNGLQSLKPENAYQNR